MKKRILVVDDFDSIRDFLCRTLVRYGYEAEGARDGNHAFEHLQNQRFDLVLSDFHMPEMNGLELLRIMRGDSVLKTLPVIFLTTSNNSDDKRTAKDLGLYGWLNKPYKIPVFLGLIESALSQQGQERMA